MLSMYFIEGNCIARRDFARSETRRRRDATAIPSRDHNVCISRQIRHPHYMYIRLVCAEMCFLVTFAM